MAALIIDRDLERELIAERRRTGADRYDEVWDGVYVMAPMANNEHQRLVTRLAYVLEDVIEPAGIGAVFAGVNVSDSPDDWTKNYRCPDVAVFLTKNMAEDRDTHWFGGPDFAVEVASDGDRTYDKLEFYSKVGARELLIVDRHPWALELFRLNDGELKPVGRSTVDERATLPSAVVPLTFRLVAGKGRPRIEVVHSAGDGRWMV